MVVSLLPKQCEKALPELQTNIKRLKTPKWPFKNEIIQHVKIAKKIIFDYGNISIKIFTNSPKPDTYSVNTIRVLTAHPQTSR